MWQVLDKLITTVIRILYLQIPFLGEVDEEFIKIRSELIKLLLTGQHWNEAGLLGEQFHDFDALITVYKATKNETDFARYLKIANFPKYIHTQFRGSELVEIAARHGGEIADIVLADEDHGWLLMAKKNEYESAHTTLLSNATKAEMSLTRRTLLSIAKLAAIAGVAQIPAISNEELLLDYQVRQSVYNPLIDPLILLAVLSNINKTTCK